MQIVININENDYKTLMINGGNCSISMAERIVDSVFKGEKLQKGHGRLIDADEAIKTLKSLGNRDYRKEKGTIREAEKMLSYTEYTPTIIEADAESEGKNDIR